MPPTKEKEKEKMVPAAATTPAVPLKTEPVTPRSKRTGGWLGWLVIILCGGALSGSLFMGWQALQPVDSTSTTLGVTVAATPTASPVPELHLNNSHQRQGASIVVNPSVIGRSDPLLTP